MELVRGFEYKVTAHGKTTNALYYGANEDGIHLFILSKKVKRPDGTSTQYLFTKEPEKNLV